MLKTMHDTKTRTMSDIMPEPLDLEPSAGYIPTQDEKTAAMLSHVLTFFGWFLAPLLVYVVKKEESEYVKHHAMESLNFQISILIYFMACIPMMLLLVGFFMAFILAILSFITIVIATVKASEGIPYRYPFTIRLIK